MTNILHAVEFTAFIGAKRLASGPLHQVAMAAKKAIDRGARQPISIYNDQTGRAIEIDSRGSDGEMLARLADPQPPPPPRGRGRPKLGVIAREITLLPRHWQWLASQPGGASMAVRKLVDRARRANQDASLQRRDAAHRFMSAMACDLVNFAEAAKALSGNDHKRLHALINGWPADIREHVVKLAFRPNGPGS